MRIKNYKPRVKNTGLKSGAFGSDFSRDFDISQLVFETENDEIAFFDSAKMALHFWDEFFRVHEIP